MFNRALEVVKTTLATIADTFVLPSFPFLRFTSSWHAPSAIRPLLINWLACLALRLHCVPFPRCFLSIVLQHCVNPKTPSRRECQRKLGCNQISVVVYENKIQRLSNLIKFIFIIIFFFIYTTNSTILNRD